MLDAVRIAGRWVDQIVLDRLTSQSLKDNAPCRSKLVERFCQVNRRAEPCTSSANVALHRLEEQALTWFACALSWGSNTNDLTVMNQRRQEFQSASD